MRKLITIAVFFTACALGTYAASLPAVGYVGPYSYDLDYGSLIDYGEESTMSITAAGNYSTINCANGTTNGQNVKWCDVCGGQLGPIMTLGVELGITNVVQLQCFAMSADGKDLYDDVCASGMFPTLNCDQSGYDLQQAYLFCAGSDEFGCGKDSDNCPIAWLCPIGTETPLIFFALSFLALRIWRRKKNAINEEPPTP